MAIIETVCERGERVGGSDRYIRSKEPSRANRIRNVRVSEDCFTDSCSTDQFDGWKTHPKKFFV